MHVRSVRKPRERLPRPREMGSVSAAGRTCQSRADPPARRGLAMTARGQPLLRSRRKRSTRQRAKAAPGAWPLLSFSRATRPLGRILRAEARWCVFVAVHRCAARSTGAAAPRAARRAERTRDAGVASMSGLSIPAFGHARPSVPARERPAGRAGGKRYDAGARPSPPTRDPTPHVGPQLPGSTRSAPYPGRGRHPPIGGTEQPSRRGGYATTSADPPAKGVGDGQVLKCGTTSITTSIRGRRLAVIAPQP